MRHLLLRKQQQYQQGSHRRFPSATCDTNDLLVVRCQSVPEMALQGVVISTRWV